MTGIVPTAPPHAAARRAEPRAAWAHPHAAIESDGIRTKAPTHRLRRHLGALEGMTGIEPAPSVWKTEALPLSYIPVRPLTGTDPS